jgi:predicted nucleic acid-binding protein
MFLLDTNVISELRKAGTGKIDPNVQAWAHCATTDDYWVSSITIEELEHGILLKEARDPRAGAILRRWFEDHVLIRFSQRTLPVDIPVARVCANLQAESPKPFRDSLIAATAIVHGMTVVTRNTQDFLSCKVATLNPWQQGN